MGLPSAYTPSQIAAWEEHVSLPEKYRQANKPTLNLDYLTSLHNHQIAAIPYENLSLHYSPTPKVILDPTFTFNKIVTAKRGRGATAWKTYMAGAKGRARKDGIPSGEFLGWVHIVSIVTFTSPSGNEERYASDVAFGGDGPCFPLPLDSSPEPPVFLNLGTQEVRIVHTNISQQLEPRHKFWFTQADFEVMSYYTSTYREGTNWQPFTVLVVGFIREGEAIVGKKMLVDAVVKRNDGGKTKLVLVCKGEEERVRVLKEEFGIELTGEEVEGIRGTGVELKCNGS
ncbi:arylamine N-acetyltransferase 1 [Rhexocercosporidium sp. MPI-PUGE-AT-0058]|nr:arylamine N-acetyltransferase 1 [Rhexocercosporidium sp. MPI-PUGE-AT-0058]